MNNYSYFIEDKALFGSYPKQEDVNVMESCGVRHFVNLTHSNEKKIQTYNTNYNYVNYPIKDYYVPTDIISFTSFIMYISKIIINLKKEEKVCIHCKGGHGRSSVVVAILLCYLYNLEPSVCIDLTNKYHNNRINMKDKWRIIGFPQTKKQYFFINKFCSKLIFYKKSYISKILGFSNISNHSVYVKGIGLFKTSEGAIQSHRNLNNKIYILNLQNEGNYSKIKELKKSILCENWEEIKDEVLFDILKLKFEQHPKLLKNLLKTGISELIVVNKNLKSNNRLGKTLMKLRNFYFNNYNYNYN